MAEIKNLEEVFVWRESAKKEGASAKTKEKKRSRARRAKAWTEQRKSKREREIEGRRHEIATEKLKKAELEGKEGASDGSCRQNEGARVMATAEGKAGEEERNRHWPLAPEFPISIREFSLNRGTVSFVSLQISQVLVQFFLNVTAVACSSVIFLLLGLNFLNIHTAYDDWS